MDGLLYVIDELGRGLAALKAENAQLREALKAHEDDAEPVPPASR